MKTYRYILSALMSVALLSACSEDIIENENPQPNPEAVQSVKLFAEISDVNTRVAYQEDGSGLKVVWEGERTNPSTGNTIPADFIFVYPGKGVNDEIDILNEEGYAFELTSGEGTSRGEFTYMGYTVKYQKTTVTENHVVDVENGVEKTEEHEVEQYTVVKSENKPFPTITAPNGKCQARWEHPLNSAGECQIENDNKEHLKYQEVMTAEISAANIVKNSSDKETINAEAEGQPAAVLFTHPKTVVFKIVMNQFLYSIHQGSHVGIVGVTDDDEEEKIGGVYLQRPEKYFAYKQKTEPTPYYLTVTPKADDPCGYGAGTETLTTYVMVETTKLQPYKKFIFALTDNWSHDLYIWKLSLTNANAFTSGQYYTVDLTSRTCLQALNMDGEVLWAVKNLGAATPYDDGRYYRYGDVTGLTPDEAHTKDNENGGEYFGRDYYNTTGTDAGQIGWADAIETFHNAFTTTTQSDKIIYTLNDGATVPYFLEHIDQTVTTTDTPQKELQQYILKKEYDAASKKYGKQWHIPYIANFFKLSKDISYNTEKGGFIVTYADTGHKIFFKSAGIYKQGNNTIGNAEQTFFALGTISLNGNQAIFVNIGKLSSNSTLGTNTNANYAVQIRPVRKPLHEHTHVSSDVITGVTTVDD